MLETRVTDVPAAPRSGFHGLGRGEITTRDELITVDAYRDLVLSGIRPIEPIEMRIEDTLGLTLAADVTCAEPLPAFANSAMDGYAVVASDVTGAGVEHPVALTVIGEVAAGAAETPLVGNGQAVRIMTGAPLPPGADAVVPVETTREDGNTVQVLRPARVGEFVRTVGQDVPAGQLLLRAGHRIRPADIGLLAAVGATRLPCHPSPRVAILSTGDELVPADTRPTLGQVRDANGPMLAAMVRQVGGIPHTGGAVPDDPSALRDAIDTNLGTADLIIATGGVSAGKFDHLQDVLRGLGDTWAHKVAMKPGMPQVFAKIEGIPVLGLPGNPVSSFVSFEVFARPAIRALQNRASTGRAVVVASLEEDVSSPPHKRSFVRVRMKRGEQGWTARPTGHQGSHVITSLARADGLAEIPEETTRARAGDRVRVHLLLEG